MAKGKNKVLFILHVMKHGQTLIIGYTLEIRFLKAKIIFYF